MSFSFGRHNAKFCKKLPILWKTFLTCAKAIYMGGGVCKSVGRLMHSFHDPHRERVGLLGLGYLRVT